MSKVNINGRMVDERTWRKINTQALVVCMLASHIEGLAVDFKDERMANLAISVRQFSNQDLGEAFGNVSEMFDTMIKEQMWLNLQLTVVLCRIIKREAEKLNKMYFDIDRSTEFPKMYECIELARIVQNNYVSKNIYDKVMETVIFFKEPCKLK